MSASNAEPRTPNEDPLADRLRAESGSDSEAGSRLAVVSQLTATLAALATFTGPAAILLWPIFSLLAIGAGWRSRSLQRRADPSLPSFWQTLHAAGGSMPARLQPAGVKSALGITLGTGIFLLWLGLIAWGVVSGQLS